MYENQLGTQMLEENPKWMHEMEWSRSRSRSRSKSNLKQSLHLSVQPEDLDLLEMKNSNTYITNKIQIDLLNLVYNST